jgi:hypothetical protein
MSPAAGRNGSVPVLVSEASTATGLRQPTVEHDALDDDPVDNHLPGRTARPAAPVDGLEALRVEIRSLVDVLEAKLTVLSNVMDLNRREARDGVPALRRDLSRSHEALCERLEAVAVVLNDTVSVWTDAAPLREQCDAGRHLLEERRSRGAGPQPSDR